MWFPGGNLCSRTVPAARSYIKANNENVSTNTYCTYILAAFVVDFLHLDIVEGNIKLLQKILIQISWTVVMCADIYYLASLVYVRPYSLLCNIWERNMVLLARLYRLNSEILPMQSQLL